MKKEEKEKKIHEVLDILKPYINSDGGDIEFVKYEDDYCYIRLLGACVGCSMIDYTIEDAIYESIKEEIPDCKGVINVDI